MCSIINSSYWIRHALRGALAVILFAGAAKPNPSLTWQAPVARETLHAAKAPLIPFPREVQWGEADWIPNEQTVLIVPAGQTKILTAAVELLKDTFVNHGLTLVTFAEDREPPPGASLRLSVKPDAAPSPEGYTLTVTSAGITLQGVDAAGAFYGAHTLRQMIWDEPEGARIQTTEIRDWPAFRLRGFMHDVGRNFQTLDSLKAQLDIFAAYKLNVFHWHLTDHPAWRIECRAYPQLNDPRFQERDAGQIYTYAQIRELIAYARKRHITVIPELDMPGHSAFFERAFGFGMASDQGMAVLENLIAEFCEEIPAKDCPYLHIGSDEIHISSPDEFMKRMLRAVRTAGRQPMIWDPGLPADEQTIRQLWRETLDEGSIHTTKAPRVDSASGYLNIYDPLVTVQRNFFHQSCRQPEGDDEALGGILCLWPDVRVAEKENIFRYNPVWSGLLAFAESIWQGRPGAPGDLQSVLPAPGCDAWESYREFEDRLAQHRDRYFAGRPFPFVKSAQIHWLVVGPFARGLGVAGGVAFEPETRIRPDYQVGADTLTWQRAWGGTVTLVSSRKDPAIFSKAETATAYALAYVHADEAKTISAWVGFETPERSNRKSGGIPALGQWEAFGGTILVNDRPVTAPHWQRPGTNRFLTPTFKTPANEDPYTDEEFYWTRPPAQIHLQAGWNKVLLRIPCGYERQNWSFTFVPVTRDARGKRWIEDESLRFSVTPDITHE